jgi:hypothetical protein
MIGPQLYRSVLKGLRKVQAHPHHVEDARFALADVGAPFVSAVVAAAEQPDGAPDGDAVYREASADVRRFIYFYRRDAAPDMNRAFWAIRRFEDIHAGRLQSATAPSAAAPSIFPFLSEAPFPFVGHTVAAGALAALPCSHVAGNDDGVQMLVQTRCAQPTGGSARYHVKFTVANRSTADACHILDTHLYVVNTSSGTLTDVVHALPIAAGPLPPGELEVPPEGTGGEDAAVVPSDTEFEVVIPSEGTCVLKGTVCYARRPVDWAAAEPSEERGELTRFGSLRTLRFGLVKMDPAVTSYDDDEPQAAGEDQATTQQQDIV